MGAVVYQFDPLDPLRREVWRHDRPTTVRRLVDRHKGLRKHTAIRRVDGRRVREFRRATVCRLNGQLYARRNWHRLTVGRDDVVEFYAPPGNPGGGGGSNPLGAILAIAIAVAVPVLGPMVGAALGISAGLGGALVGIGLSAAAYGLSQLFAQPPPSAVSSGYGGGSQSSPTYNLQAQGNYARLGAAIPELIGRHQVYPDLIADSYTRFVDNEMYVHMMLGVSKGQVDVEELRIGDTPFSSFADGDITYELLEPGEVGDLDIMDSRWLVSRDLAEPELPDASAGSPWVGPFPVNPPGTTVQNIEIDTVCPQGLFKIGSGGVSGKSLNIDIEARQIDDDGEPLDDWIEVDAIVVGDNRQSPVRRTHGQYVLPSAGRWQVRCRRTDARDTDNGVAHTVNWTGLRGRPQSAARKYEMTTLAFKGKATGSLNSSTIKRVNGIFTRRLPTWDESAMGTELVATRSPCDALAHIARTSNGGRLRDDQIDLAGLYRHKADFEARGWTFDFVFDSRTTIGEALGYVARAVVGERVVQGGQLRLVRDEPSVAPVKFFSPRNIRRGSVSVGYAMVTSETADALKAIGMDTKTWKPMDITVSYPESRRETIAEQIFHGVTNKPQLAACAWHRVRGNKLRRREVRWRTELEGAAILFGDAVSFSWRWPKWGQTAEVKAWDPTTRTLTLTEPLTWTAGATHLLAIRTSTATASGPFEATAVAGQPTKVKLGAGLVPEIHTDGTAERTVIQFGIGTAYARQLKVTRVEPQDEATFQITAIDDDPGMYEPIPDDGLPDPGGPQDDLEIHVAANVANLSLRTLANANGYTGLPTQQVTVIVDAGVHVHATGTGQAALRRGPWPAGYRPILINLGTISGAGGAGGKGAVSGGYNGGAALDASNGPLEVDNTDGTIRGGGGGGGGGGNGYYETVESVGDGGSIVVGHSVPGGGGGGGAGLNDAAGGQPAGDGTAAIGGYGGAGGPGAGGAGGTVTVGETTHEAGDGGAGGDWGEAGSAGESSNTPGQAGGAPGNAVVGNGNITWVATGTRIGPIA